MKARACRTLGSQARLLIRRNLWVCIDLRRNTRLGGGPIRDTREKEGRATLFPRSMAVPSKRREKRDLDRRAQRQERGGERGTAHGSLLSFSKYIDSHDEHVYEQKSTSPKSHILLRVFDPTYQNRERDLCKTCLEDGRTVQE